MDFPLASKGGERTDDLLTKVGRKGTRIKKAELREFIHLFNRFY